MRESDPPAGSGVPAGAPATRHTAEFEAFAARHCTDLGKLAHLLTADPDVADELTADTLLAVWRQWDRIRDLDHPMGYVRRMMSNLAASRWRSLYRESRRALLFRRDAMEVWTGPDAAAQVDVRAALARLPAGRRACLVLRYALDLSEKEVAETLGISVGTVKSQTAKAARQLREELGEGPDVTAAGTRPGSTDHWPEVRQLDGA